MKERPIIFSPEMVQAILTCAKCGKISIKFPCEHCGSEEFRKTQTRRVIKSGMDSADITGAENIRDNIWRPLYSSFADCGRIVHKNMPKCWTFKAPYQVGDLLWVRECWRVQKGLDEQKPSNFAGWSVNYKDGMVMPLGFNDRKNWGKWRSGRFMPKWAARIRLEITDNRAEQLQDITEIDCIAEGCPNIKCDEDMSEVLEWYMNLWDELNAKRGFDWESNPWVWVNEFKRTNKTSADSASSAAKEVKYEKSNL